MNERLGKSSLKTGFSKYMRDIGYSLPLLVCLVATYGYFLTHYSVSIDDLSGDRYYFGELFAQGRFTNTILHHLFGILNTSVLLGKLYESSYFRII